MAISDIYAVRCDMFTILSSPTYSLSCWPLASSQLVPLPFLCGCVSVGLIQVTTTALCSKLLRPSHTKKTASISQHGSSSSCSFTLSTPSSAMFPWLGEDATDASFRAEPSSFLVLSTWMSYEPLLWTLPHYFTKASQTQVGFLKRSVMHT